MLHEIPPRRRILKAYYGNSILKGRVTKVPAGNFLAQNISIG
jgi:hypothetical protein